MAKTVLGKLEKLELRSVWSSESGDFTPWLALKENLKLLGDSIGLALECETQEKRVGPFRADILCKNSNTDGWILIENQLERTDHTHLGQLLTYAASLDTVTIVWVAERFTEEHRAALDWLNEHTDEHINFFGLEVELWRIGNSAPAPKFNVVCKPNEWTRVMLETAKNIATGELTEHRQLQYQYWSDFLAVLRRKKQVTEARSPQPSGWMGFPLGRAGFRLWTELYFHEKEIGVGLTFAPPHSLYFSELLRKQSSEIEKELGVKFNWDINPDRGQNYIAVYCEFDPSDRSTWPKQHEWLAERLERFQKVLGRRIKLLPPPPESGEAT